MSTHVNLADGTVEMVTALIRAEIPAAMTAIRTDRSDPQTRTHLPVTYFNHEPPAHAYKTPAIFVVVDDIDFRLADGANFVNVSINMNVGIVVEDQVLRDLTKRCYRYQAALQKILQGACLDSADAEVRLRVLVQRASFSPIFTDAQEKGNSKGVFRKECILEIECRQFEEQ